MDTRIAERARCPKATLIFWHRKIKANQERDLRTVVAFRKLKWRVNKHCRAGIVISFQKQLFMKPIAWEW